MHERIKQHYDRNTSLVYYDVTNYYFEKDKQDELRRKGISKEHRPDPIVQMGLFMTEGVSLAWDFRTYLREAHCQRPIVGMSIFSLQRSICKTQAMYVIYYKIVFLYSINM